MPERAPKRTLLIRLYLPDQSQQPLYWVIEAAAMVVITLSNGGVGGASDWSDLLGSVLTPPPPRQRHNHKKDITCSPHRLPRSQVKAKRNG
ncbi:hypothetical protein CF326_g5141 [Tilletia indica]|nr:hypothetical protein CF326_g5141 [Tilletia indica]